MPRGSFEDVVKEAVKFRFLLSNIFFESSRILMLSEAIRCCVRVAIASNSFATGSLQTGPFITNGKNGDRIFATGILALDYLLSDTFTRILKLKSAAFLTRNEVGFLEGGVKMETYVILSRFSPEAFDDPKEFLKLAEQVSKKIREQCPGIKWKESYATLGRFDVVDIVEASDPKDIEKAAMIIRAYGHSTTETLAATPWKTFLQGL